MYIATVIPIHKGINKEYLSYFSLNRIPLGSIVSIPVRLKVIDAIIIALEDASDLKSDIKNSSYQLKKIIAVRGPSPFSEEFFHACELMKAYTVSTSGIIIKNLLSPLVLDYSSQLVNSNVFTKENNAQNLKQEKLIFQSQSNDRISFYRTLIREAFAKKQSIFLCVPTRIDVTTYERELTKGIEQYVFSFHGTLPQKIMKKSYEEMLAMEHPVLIIGTGTFLSIPRHDIHTLVIEHESSEAYKQLARPYIDIRNFAEVLSSLKGWKLILADTLLRPDTLYRHEQGELGEVYPPLFRVALQEQQSIIDMNQELDEKGFKKFNILSHATKVMITQALQSEESVFLFSVRKGLAGVTVCHDCGHTLLCPSCSTPIVLYSSNKKAKDDTKSLRVFMCNKCGRKESADISCPICSSWNLVPLGIGTDRVYEEVQKNFPGVTIIQIDKETTPSEKEAREAALRFSKTRGAVLIATEMAFSYMVTPVIHSALISLDGLLSIPSFNITQKILHIIERLHSFTTKNLIIQTRLPENIILRQIISGNILPLYREDLQERKKFGYPPFKRLIKITFTGTKEETEKARSYLERAFSNYEPQIFSAFISKIKGNYITNTIIRVDPQDWPLPTRDNIFHASVLHETLSSLPLSFSINVDPEDLL